MVNTLLSVMLSIAVLTNEVCTAWSNALFVLASNGTTVWLCIVKVSASFPSVDDPSWCCGDRHYRCLTSVSDIAQRKDSGGPRPVASWSYSVGGQYLTSYVSL